MRKTLMTAALLLAFSCPALAGEIATPGSPAPPPTSNAVQEPTSGETFNGEMPTPPDASESLTQTVLELLAALPSLL
jgi:hypothetical protein